MMLNCRCFLTAILLLFNLVALRAQTADSTWLYKQDGWSFEWNLKQDQAKLVSPRNNSVVWQGSLLPGFWLRINKKDQFIKAEVNAAGSAMHEDQLELALKIGNIGKGKLLVKKEEWGIRISELIIDWIGTPPAIIDMYFGASAVHQKKGGVMEFTWDRPFLPDWQCFGYCVPGAKGGTPQSYFRMWDFGHANIALGSFGPSTGTPYGAAFPRPLYYAAMGSNDGYIAMGAGSVPDAAMSLRIQSTRGCFEYVYREDLWGALPGKQRVWKEPLYISFGDNPWNAFKKYYSAFPKKKESVANASLPVWNTWGMWGKKKYVIRPIADFAKKINAGIMVMDDPWEVSQGAGKPNLERFPDFFKDQEYIRSKGMLNGIWEAIGWISDPFSAGLSNKDLIRNKDGIPCKANWNFDPREQSYYCMDLSSASTREFIRQRTIQIMKTVKPSLIKLDFGYGLPSPHMGVPENPIYRGERYSVEMIRLIADAAKSVDPGVAIMYYSLSPLLVPVIDLVSMDDQGDLWYEVARGHQEWSIWASLLSDMKVPVNGSSSYNWATDDEVLLNTCIFGIPGGVLPIYDLDDGKPIRDAFLNRRLAMNKWYRKTIAWMPLWLNSHTGDFNAAPKLNCWGRLENNNGDTLLTALVLRNDGSPGLTDKRITTMKWQGRWAMIAQDNMDIFRSSKLALIPFDKGMLSYPCETKPGSIMRLNMSGESIFEKWEWSNGILTINVTEELFNDTGGFLVNR